MRAESAVPEACARGKETNMIITYLGHACVKVESGGYAVVIDPYTAGSVPGYGDLHEQAQEVICSHEHGDHHGVDEIEILPVEGPTPFLVTQVDSWHDDKEGALRGPNRITVLEAEGLKVVHMGDIGHLLEPAQVEELTGADLLMIPVGGYYTVDAAGAKAIVDQLAPKAVLPMHYRGEGFGFDVIGPLSAFTALFDEAQVFETGASFDPTEWAAGGPKPRIVAARAKYRLK